MARKVDTVSNYQKGFISSIRSFLRKHSEESFWWRPSTYAKETNLQWVSVSVFGDPMGRWNMSVVLRLMDRMCQMLTRKFRSSDKSRKFTPNIHQCKSRHQPRIGSLKHLLRIEKWFMAFGELLMSWIFELLCRKRFRATSPIKRHYHVDCMRFQGDAVGLRMNELRFQCYDLKSINECQK